MRPDRIPVSIEERRAVLDLLRERKMTSSAHAYVRGSTERFYKWLLSTRGKSLPPAPEIWIGGDCHVGNLGPLANAEGRYAIQLRDLDQTVIGSPAHDVIRFCLSMVMAIRASGLPGEVSIRAVEAVARGYEIVLESFASNRGLPDAVEPAALSKVMRAAGRRSRKDLFQERLGKNDRVIPIGSKFWPLQKKERAAVEELIATEEMRALVHIDHKDAVDSIPSLVDAAYWVKGCSSLGLWRCAALVEVGKTGSSRGELRLFDLKEALPALAPRSKGTRMPRHHGQRVVTGARMLSPNLGNRMIASTVLDKPIFIRELLPQDSKFELDNMSASDAIETSAYLGGVIGTAHGRQLDAPQAVKWLATFRHEMAAKTHAPSWLWAAVVDLVALHEGAYLEHCRCHADRPAPSGTSAAEATVISHHVEDPLASGLGMTTGAFRYIRKVLGHCEERDHARWFLAS